MLPHHERAIARLIERYQPDPHVLALIIGGSVIKKRALPDSDIDFVLVLDEETFRAAHAALDITLSGNEETDYPGGYVDGKRMSVAFLEQMALKGSEPARSAFKYHHIAFSRVEGLEALLDRVTRYPLEDKVHRIRNFYAQLEGLKWFMCETVRRPNAFLEHHTAVHFVLYAGRLILAHNEILFPSFKWFWWELEHAPDKPEGICALLRTMLERPSMGTADAIWEALNAFREWEKPGERWANRFVINNEWCWLEDKTPIQEW